MQSERSPRKFQRFNFHRHTIDVDWERSATTLAEPSPFFLIFSAWLARQLQEKITGNFFLGSLEGSYCSDDVEAHYWRPGRIRRVRDSDEIQDPATQREMIVHTSQPDTGHTWTISYVDDLTCGERESQCRRRSYITLREKKSEASTHKKVKTWWNTLRMRRRNWEWE